MDKSDLTDWALETVVRLVVVQVRGDKVTDQFAICREFPAILVEQCMAFTNALCFCNTNKTPQH